MSNRFTRGWISHHSYRQSLLVVALVVVCAPRATADPLTINTVGPDGLPNVLVGNFGEPNAATVGQTFIAPPHAWQLDRFTFYLFYVAGGPARFAGYVGNWDGAKVTGSLLYASGERQLTTPLTPIPVTFGTGGVPVTPGRRYVAFLSASNFFDGLADNTNLFLEDDTYADGRGVGLPNGNNFSGIFTSNWGAHDPRDLAFVAEFTPVPEPSTMMLLGAGVAFDWLVRRKGRRARIVGAMLQPRALLDGAPRSNAGRGPHRETRGPVINSRQRGSALDEVQQSPADNHTSSLGNDAHRARSARLGFSDLSRVCPRVVLLPRKRAIFRSNSSKAAV